MDGNGDDDQGKGKDTVSLKELLEGLKDYGYAGGNNADDENHTEFSWRSEYYYWEFWKKPQYCYESHEEHSGESKED